MIFFGGITSTPLQTRDGQTVLPEKSKGTATEEAEHLPVREGKRLKEA